MKKTSILLLLAASSTGIAMAQKQDNKGPLADTIHKTLQEVTVLSAKNTSSSLTRSNTPLRDIPQNVQTIGRTLLNDQQAFRVDDAFKYMAGITAAIY